MGSLQAWSEEFGDMEFFPDKDNQSSVFSMDYDVAYACSIAQAKVVKSSRGDMQVELSINVLSGKPSSDFEPSVLGRRREWLELPKQLSDKGKDKKLVERITQRRFENMIRILSAAEPIRFALYAEKTEGRDGKPVYKDFEGAIMGGPDFDARRAHVQKECVRMCELLHDMEGEFVDWMSDTLVFIEKVENKKNEKYPFTNYYPTAPYKTPVFFKESDGEPPF